MREDRVRGSRHQSLGIVIALLCVACGPPRASAPDLRSFDKIVTRELVTSAFQRRIPISFEVLQHDSTRIYRSDYQFRRADSADHYTCFITVAAAGTLLDSRNYQHLYSETERNYADRGKEYLLRQFPRIGKRAQRNVFAFGPGGAAFGLTFTTSDTTFDVRIMVSNLLPAGIEDPGFDVDGAARRISELYDRSVGASPMQRR